MTKFHPIQAIRILKFFRKKSTGFSLVESLVALLLLSITIGLTLTSAHVVQTPKSTLNTLHRHLSEEMKFLQGIPEKQALPKTNSNCLKTWSAVESSTLSTELTLVCFPKK